MKDPFKNLILEEKFIADAIVSARKIQTFLWGQSNGAWGLEEWRRMFIKRFHKINAIDPKNPHAIIELKKRLMQNAALSIALMTILHYGGPLVEQDLIPSNLPDYIEYPEED